MTPSPEELQLQDRGEVLSGQVPFDRARWLPILPDSGWWPSELDSCVRVGRWPRVDRRTVFDIARRAEDAAGRRHLLVAALVWGSGTKAQSVARRGRIFAESSARDIDGRLEAVLGLLHEEGVVAAYYAFNNDNRIRFLGPAFFTKVLYFAGHDHPTGPLRPLILDSVVSRALKAAARVEIPWPENGWSTEQYRRYLTTIHEQALAAGVLPDVIESAWFDYGRKLSRSGATSLSKN